MQKKLLLLTACCCFYVASFSQKLMNINKNVTISLPEDFKNFANIANPAEALFRNAKGNAVLKYRFGTDSVSDNDIPAFVDDQLKLARQDDESFEYIDDGIHLQDGKNIGYLKFSTKESGKKYFNYVFFISVDSKPLVFRFNCPLKEQKKWDTEIDKAANSLRVVQ